MVVADPARLEMLKENLLAELEKLRADDV